MVELLAADSNAALKLTVAVPAAIRNPSNEVPAGICDRNDAEYSTAVGPASTPSSAVRPTLAVAGTLRCAAKSFPLRVNPACRLIWRVGLEVPPCDGPAEGCDDCPAGKRGSWCPAALLRSDRHRRDMPEPPARRPLPRHVRLLGLPESPSGRATTARSGVRAGWGRRTAVPGARQRSPRHGRGVRVPCAECRHLRDRPAAPHDGADESPRRDLRLSY